MASRTPDHDLAEYKSLRDELIGYIRQQFDASVVVVTASSLLFAYAFTEHQGWLFLCVYPLLLMAVAHMVRSGDMTLRIASYIRVFHENDDTDGWETRVAEFRRRKPTLLPGLPYQILYIGIALVASIGATGYATFWAAVLCAWGLFTLWAALDLLLVVLRLRCRYRLRDMEVIEFWRKTRAP